MPVSAPIITSVSPAAIQCSIQYYVTVELDSLATVYFTKMFSIIQSWHGGNCHQSLWLLYCLLLQKNIDVLRLPSHTILLMYFPSHPSSTNSFRSKIASFSSWSNHLAHSTQFFKPSLFLKQINRGSRVSVLISTSDSEI